MMRTRTVRAGVFAGGALVALLVAGCNAGQNTGAGSQSVQPVMSSTDSSSASPTESSTPQDSGTGSASTGTAKPTATNTDPGASPNDCKASELTLSLSGGDAGAGHVFRSLRFTNKGSRTCTMQGFPGVSYVTGDSGQQVGPAAYRSGSKGSAISLKPGATAYAAVDFVNVRNYDASACKPTSVRGLRVYPPHDTASLFVSAPGTGCAKTPPGNQLSVQTVRTGTGP